MDEFILVADDDPALSRLVRSVVEGEGFVVTEAKDGKEAYKALKSGANFVGAVIDINMPYIDGNDLVKFMRNENKFASIPVLIMTGDRDPRASEKAIGSGAAGFLPKPFTNDQLRNALRTLIAPRST